MFQGAKGYIAQISEVHLQFENSTTKWPVYTFFLVNSTLIYIYCLWSKPCFPFFTSDKNLYSKSYLFVKCVCSENKFNELKRLLNHLPPAQTLINLKLPIDDSVFEPVVLQFSEFIKFHRCI